jgi:hypothetical protein
MRLKLFSEGNVMKHLLKAVCAILSLALVSFAQTKPDIIIFDEGDANGTFYDASWGNVTTPSTLTLGGGGADKLIIDTVHHYTGNKSGLLQWKSVTGGDWNLFIASLKWATINATGYDSLVFFINSRGAIPPNQMPTIGLETDTPTLSVLDSLGKYLPSGTDADTTTWQRVTIPLTVFTGFNLSILKDVNFHQNTADNVLHTIWVDNIRIVSKANAPDTTLPSSPMRVVTRSGDKSVVLHWNLNPENTIAGYNVYRATSASGPFTKLTSSALPLPSFADLVVTNAQAYYYYVRAVNSNLAEGDNSDTVTVTPQVFANDDAFLDYVEQTAFDYFWYEANPTTGLIKDRSTKNSSSSIAAIGFGLTAIGVGVDRGWITREEGRDRTLITLNTFWQGPQSVLASNMIGYKGWFYHFLDMKTATRAGTCELSSIDTGLLLAGIVYSKQYFNGTDTTETKIRSLADSIYNRIDWNWMRNSASSLTMGWYPESGFIGERWIGYNEAMILYILGIGAPANPLPPSSWNAWTNGYQWFFNNWLSDYFVSFAPLFGHQYSHCWVDFRNIADDYMKSKGITYFENSRRATLAQRLYCIDNPGQFVGYGPNMWGITASDVPNGYNARGTNMNDDGTLNATAPGGSMPFAPEICLPALRNMYDTHRTTIWTGYGFCDAFNLSVNPVWWDADVLGIDQGPIIIMAENYRTGKVWNTFMKEKIVTDGLQRAGFTTVTDVAEAKQTAPKLYTLEQNYPNPFNPTTEIRYNLSKQNLTFLKVYDVLGREIATLVDRIQEAGTYAVSFDASQIPSGVYFYTLNSGEYFSVKKMLLIR